MRSLLVVLIFAANIAAFTTINRDTLSSWMVKAPFDYVLIDVREPQELTSVIGNARCQPYNLPWASKVFDAQYSKLPKDHQIILYCRSGNRSGKAAKVLDSLGYRNVYNLKGGMLKWNGSKIGSSKLLPISDLPKISMKKTEIQMRPVKM